MKIHTRVVLDWVTGEVLSDETEEYDGPVALCDGGEEQAAQSVSNYTQNQNSTISPKYSKFQLDMINAAKGPITDFASNPPKLYPNTAIASYNPTQVQGQQQVLDATGAQQDIANNAANTQAFLSGPVLDPNQNPGLQGAIQAAYTPLMRTYLQQIMPNIRSNALNTGQFGGSRQGIAEGMATQGLETALGDTAANIINPAYQSGLSAMTQGLALAPSTQGTQTVPGQTTLGVGDTNYALEQARLSEEAQKYVDEQLLPFLSAKQVWDLIFKAPVGQKGESETTGSSLATSTGTGGGLSTGQGILGGAAIGTSLLGNFM
jgi:hypothetical protein